MNAGEGKLGTVAVWQKRLLPFMIAIISALTCFFFAASFIQLFRLQQQIEKYPEIDLDQTFKSMEVHFSGLDEKNKIDFTKWKTLSVLEKQVLNRRYHQANALLMSRIWREYLGFVTGMILTIVGAVFILGKLRAPATTLEAGWKGASLSLITTSPGILLAVLGTLLMYTTIATHHQITVDDKSTYVQIGAIQGLLQESAKTDTQSGSSNWADQGQKAMKNKEDTAKERGQTINIDLNQKERKNEK